MHLFVIRNARCMICEELNFIQIAHHESRIHASKTRDCRTAPCHVGVTACRFGLRKPLFSVSIEVNMLCMTHFLSYLHAYATDKPVKFNVFLIFVYSNNL